MLQTFGCKAFIWHSWSSSVAANYHVVAVAVDRVLAITVPFWHMNHSSPANAKKISFAIALMSYLLDLPLLRIFGTQSEEERCEVQEREYEQLAFYYISFVIYFVAMGEPIVLLLVSNFVFVFSLMRKRSSAVQSRRDTTQSQTKSKNERSYVLMLLVLTCSYLLLSCSNAALQMILIGRADGLTSAQTSFFEVALEIPVIFNNSLNFVFYFISGQMFRKAFKKALGNLFGNEKQTNAGSTVDGKSYELEKRNRAKNTEVTATD